MGRAAQKRKRNRSRFLTKLYATDPKRFQLEWQKRLMSWSEEIENRAKALNGKRAFQVIEEAREALSDSNGTLSVTEAQQLIQVLEHDAAQAIAGQYDLRLYHLLPRREKR